MKTMGRRYRPYFRMNISEGFIDERLRIITSWCLERRRLGLQWSNCQARISVGMNIRKQGGNSPREETEQPSCNVTIAMAYWKRKEQ